MNPHRTAAHRGRRLTGLALLLVLLLAGLDAPSAARAASFTVTSTADSGPGSLRDAIAAATASPGADEITFQLPGCPCTITLASELEVPGGELTIMGPGAAQLTLSGNHAVRVLRVEAAAKLEVQGVTIADGNTAGLRGGGIHNSGTLAVSNSTISDNSAPSNFGGGGILNSGGTVSLRNSIVANSLQGGDYAGPCPTTNGY